MHDQIIEKLKKTNIMTATESYVVRYPGFVKLAETQMKRFWFPDEYDVEKDKQDLLVNLWESERHAINTALKLFTLYEITVGDYWANYIIPNFPRPEIKRMASAFCNVENNSHAPFYDQINQVLGLSNDEFYESYKQNKVLLDRVKSIGSFIDHKNPLVSVAAFSFIEGVVLYSSFALIKSFSSQGHSYMRATGSGINASAIDENLHAMGGAGIYNELMLEAELTPEEVEFVQSEVREALITIVSHEDLINDMFFEKGNGRTVTKHQNKMFIRSRANECLHNLNQEPMFTNLKGNTIPEWFYSGINNYQMVDFFSVTGREYRRGWNRDKLRWVPKNVNK